MRARRKRHGKSHRCARRLRGIDQRLERFAIGMPSSMCVPWMSPVESESRIAAQLAPLLIVDSMPYFLKNPFSCAMTSGEQSVSAIIPNFKSVVSGASLAVATCALDGVPVVGADMDGVDVEVP